MVVGVIFTSDLGPAQVVEDLAVGGAAREQVAPLFGALLIREAVVTARIHLHRVSNQPRLRFDLNNANIRPSGATLTDQPPSTTSQIFHITVQLNYSDILTLSLALNFEDVKELNPFSIGGSEPVTSELAF